jgi:hypothetical protein
MKKSVLLLGAAVLTFGIAAAHEAQAQPRWRGGGVYRGGWHGGGWHGGGWRGGGWRGRGWGGGGAVAAGLIGGALIGGLISSAASAPYYGYGYGYPYNYRYAPTYPYAGAYYGGSYGYPYYGGTAYQETVYEYPNQQVYYPAPVYRPQVAYYPRPVYRTRVVYRQAPVYGSRRVLYSAPVYRQNVVRSRPRARVVYRQVNRDGVITTGSINVRRDVQRARVMRRGVY